MGLGSCALMASKFYAFVVSSWPLSRFAVKASLASVLEAGTKSAGLQSSNSSLDSEARDLPKHPGVENYVLHLSQNYEPHPLYSSMYPRTATLAL